MKKSNHTAIFSKPPLSARTSITSPKTSPVMKNLDSHFLAPPLSARGNSKERNSREAIKTAIRATHQKSPARTSNLKAYNSLASKCIFHKFV